MDTNAEISVITVEWDMTADVEHRGIGKRVCDAFRGLEPVHGEPSKRCVCADVPVDRAAALLAALQKIKGVGMTHETYKERARMRRVVDLLNAIADLRKGDLLAVLELDRCTHLMDDDDDTFELDDDGNVIHIPWQSSKSLRHRVQTGKVLENILRDHLVKILILGEGILDTFRKSSQQYRTDLGGRRFVT